MQSFRDPGGFQGAQQNFQQARADSARLETYRQQNAVAQTYEAHGMGSKEYYNQQTYQGYGNSAAGSYFSGTKQVSVSHTQGRSSNYQSGGYSRQFQSEGQPSKWGSPTSSVTGLSQYVQDSFKGSVPSTTSVAVYPQQHMAGGAAQNPQPVPGPHTHFMQQQQPHHKPLMQQASPYVSRPAHFNQAFQSSPNAYQAVQDYSHTSRSYEGFAQMPSSPRYDQQSAAAPDYPTQAGYGYKAAIGKAAGYEQNKAAHVKQQNLQYHSQAKMHLLNQSPQVYYQPDAPVKSPEQFYQTFSPASTHSPVSTVVRSPSYSSTPSPLMPNPEALQFVPSSEGGSMAPDIKGNVSHLMPAAATSTNQGSGKTQADACKVFLKEKNSEKLLSDGAFSSLVALSSQVENIPRTVQQLLLSNTLAPHRKMAKRLPKKAEFLKELRSPKESMYSGEEALGTPQADLQEGDYSSSSEDQMEKIQFFQNHAANLDALRKNLDSILACSGTSPSEVLAEIKSEDSVMCGESCTTASCLSKLATDGHASLFGNEDAKTSSVIILKDSFKERLETEFKFNHLEGGKEGKCSPLNLESADNFFGHLIHPKRTGQTLGSDCNDGRIKSEYPMMTKRFADDSGSESQLFPNRSDSANLLQPMADYKDNLVSSLSGSNRQFCSSLISSASQDLEKLNLFDLPDRRGREQPGEWGELDADIAQCHLQNQYLQKVHANYKGQSPLETDLAPPQFTQAVDGTRGTGQVGPEVGEGRYSELRLLANDQEPSTGKVTADEEPEVEPTDPTAPQDHAAALAERKSVICDVSPTRSAAKEVVSPGNCGNAEGNATGEAKVGPSLGPRLLGHSVIHVGPAIVAESKADEEDPSSAALKPEGECGRHTDQLAEGVLNPAAAETPDLPALSSDLISSALTEIENGPTKEPASRGARVRRLSARVAQGAGSRGKDHSPPRADDNMQHLKMVPTKQRCLAPQRDRARSKLPQQGFAAAEPVENTPTRMCTRSSTVLVDAELPLQSRTLLRRRMSSQREDAPRELCCCSRQRQHTDPDKCLIHRQAPNASVRAHLPTSVSHSRPACTAHPDHPVSQDPNSYKSVVLRARTRAQGQILHKDAKQRKNCDLAHNRCLAPRNNSSVARIQKQLTSRQEPLDHIAAEVATERLKTRNSASRLEGVEDQRFSLSHPLKRKGYCSFPLIPAKRQHQMVKASDTRTEKQKQLPGPSSDINLAAPTSVVGPAQGTSSEGSSEHAVSKGTDPNFQSGISLKTPPKTKILPPRKGRGLKLEAIVQKITSPNSKSFACSNYSDSSAPCLTLDEILSLKEDKLSESAIGEVPEQNKATAKDAAQKIAPVDTSKKCLIASKRLKEAHECRAQEKSSLRGKSEVKAAVEPDVGEAGEQTTVEVTEEQITTPDRSPPLASPSSGLASTLDPGARVELESSQDVVEPRRQASPKCCLPPTKRRGHPTGNKAKQTKSNSKVKRPSGRGARRRRKHLKGTKVTKTVHRRKKQLKRRNLPMVDSKEPVIRLKYVSYKMPRAGNTVMAFSPYVRVEKNNAVSSICTIINTLSEEQSRFQKMKKRSPASQAPLSVSKTLPTTSALLPGPVVLDSTKQGYLLCCLCGMAKNHKGLGDLFGPYYPEDYIPPVTKNQHVRGKIEVKNGIKETPSRLSIEPKVADSESESPVSSRAEAPSHLEKAAEVEDQSPLRTSSREKCKKLSCYCCEKTVEDTELRKARRRAGVEEEQQPPELPIDPQERWLHGACAVWTSGVYLAAGKLYGLLEAVEMASEMRCSMCEQTGATLGCYTKGCNQKYHYICAIESGCQLSEENFSMKCSKHKSISSKTL
ncbi:retinoic acid-induced protein 1 [Amblyraja radiata]|uniref:retinoic acid-induced protein 1 n=1 Tax=Amblyraja radiata TaxID=386614 RepID=UPI00140405AE|nr:retinoic acid-induced protein 1 [Amblyraja radiata]XP_032896670.1 retinoic acid-induced protein 1 [Amblyraja radiata]